MIIPVPLLTLFLAPTTPHMPRTLSPDLQAYVDREVLPAMSTIPDERKESLDLIADFIRDRGSAGTTADLTFICTHNSRRSHLSQIWAEAAAYYFGIEQMRAYSGGTEATAFNPRAVAAIERAGFAVEYPDGPNPRVLVRFAPDAPSLTCWSKVYDDPANPAKDFCAVMTCSHADANCPIVRGAMDRISLPYDDPKVADGTLEEAQRYDERCLQIATELFYVMRQAAR